MLYNILLIVQILVSVSIIVLVLMQHGKGADAGAAFGSGSSGTIFGAQGSANFLSRATAILASIFFVNCLALAMIVSHRPGVGSSLMTGAATQQKAVEAKTTVTATPNSDVPVAPVVAGSDVPAAPGATNTPAVVAPAQNAVPAASSAPVAAPAQQDVAPVVAAPANAEVPAAPVAPAQNAVPAQPVPPANGTQQ